LYKELAFDAPGSDGLQPSLQGVRYWLPDGLAGVVVAAGQAENYQYK
jgi:hypothetical protein